MNAMDDGRMQLMLESILRDADACADALNGIATAREKLWELVAIEMANAVVNDSAESRVVSINKVWPSDLDKAQRRIQYALNMNEAYARLEEVLHTGTAGGSPN